MLYTYWRNKIPDCTMSCTLRLRQFCEFMGRAIVLCPQYVVLFCSIFH